MSRGGKEGFGLILFVALTLAAAAILLPVFGLSK